MHITCFIVAFATLAGANVHAGLRTKLDMLPQGTPSMAPAEPRFLPKTWGPVFVQQPKYPTAALREGVSGYALTWIRFGLDGCPQRAEVVRSSDTRFVAAALPVIYATRAVIPADAQGPFWHLTPITFVVDSGPLKPQWLLDLDALNPEPADPALTKKLRKEHWRVMKKSCPKMEVLDPGVR